MKFIVNKGIGLENDQSGSVAIYPSGMRIRLSQPQMELMEEFESPRDVAEVGAAFKVPGKDVRYMIARLQDFILIVPDDPNIVNAPLPQDLLIDPDDSFRSTMRSIRGYTMGTPELCFALYQAVQYVTSAGISGAIVESGVWRGGNVALCARTLMQHGDTSRDLYIFDTFSWSWPDLSEFDTVYGQTSAEKRNEALKKRRQTRGEVLDAQQVSEARVREFVGQTGYPADKIVSVKGLVQDTMPEHAPEQIALLRLDTDLYESTYHELVHLYPRLVSGGILLIDDYPTEHGCVKAVEKYFDEAGVRPFLSRIDIQGRIGIKP